MWRLYVILDPEASVGRPLEALAAAAVEGGADAIQLRDKHASDAAVGQVAKQLLSITRPRGIPLIINDRPSVAQAVGADGVHVGQSDLPIGQVRQIVDRRMIVGKSTHSLEQAQTAEEEGADYVGFGPIFSTPTKPDYLAIGLKGIAEVRKRLRIPVVCIGGIDKKTIDAVVQAGAGCVAVVRSVCAAEDPRAAASHLKEKLAQFDRASRRL